MNLKEIENYWAASSDDDYKRSFYKICTEDFAGNYLKIGREMIQWLKSQMK